MCRPVGRSNVTDRCATPETDLRPRGWCSSIMPNSVSTQTPPPSAGKAVRVAAGGKTVAVFNVDGALRAIDAACPHVGGPLERGAVAGGVVTCPLHGSQFDLATGALKRGPAARAVTSYPVRVENGNLVIEVP